MKRVAVLMLVLAMIVSMTACASSKPEDAVKAFCEDLKSANLDKLRSYVLEKESGEESGEESLTNIADNTQMAFLLDYFNENVPNMTYEIKEVATEGDNSKVTVEFTYVDASEAAKRAMQDLMLWAFSHAFSEPSEEETAEAAKDCFKNAIDTTKTSEATVSVVFELSKTDGKWVLNDIPEEVANIYSNNMLQIFESLSGGLG